MDIVPSPVKNGDNGIFVLELRNLHVYLHIYELRNVNLENDKKYLNLCFIPLPTFRDKDALTDQSPSLTLNTP